MSTKILTIIGATGNQGGSVITTVLDNPELSQKYKLRAISRDPTKDSAKALEAKGVDVVKADLDDVESLKQAFEGSYGVFGVTNYWEIFSKDKEVQQGKNIADAVKATGVKHFIWSGLPHATELSNGEIKHVDHFNGKAEITRYIENLDGDFIFSLFEPGAFTSALKDQLGPDENGIQTWVSVAYDTTPYPWLDAQADSGKYIIGLFEAGDKAHGARVQAVTAWETPAETVEALSKVTGTKIQFKHVSSEEFKSILPDYIKNEFNDAVIFLRDYNFYGKGAQFKQDDSDRWLLKGAKKSSWKDLYERTGPWPL